MEKHISQWLAAYHDGELKGRRLAQVEAHLADCPECLKELEALDALSALLNEAPDAPVLTAPDRFAAQVGLRLPRRKAFKPQPAARKAWVWAALPVTLMVGMGFLWTVQWLAASLELAQLLGFGEDAVSRLTSASMRPPGLLGEASADFIKFGVPFSPQLLIGVILPAILAVAYLLWLIVWGLNQQESETI
jgi:anti-sigma factor RsiW